jgi:hypothetical protein
MKHGSEELRMYCLVMYNLSPIQQGIQASHAITELSMVGVPITDKPWPNFSYVEWAEHWKTMIVLNGGTSLEEDQLHKVKDPHVAEVGSMQMHREKLKELGIPFGEFYEPDLNFSLSALAFVLPKSIFAPNKFLLELIGDNPKEYFEARRNLYSDHATKQLIKLFETYNWIKNFKLA